MKSAPILVAAVAAGTLTFVAARPAHALGPLDLELGDKAGVATNPYNVSGSENPMGFGLGGRAGVSIFGLYGGIQAMYYFGSSQSVDGTSFSSHTVMYGFEGGYGFSLPMVPITIRPQVGIGNATFTASGGGESASNSNVYVEPGVTVLVSLLGWYVGADANVLVFPGLDNSQVAVTFHGQVGVKF
jgi:hypothetical protein